MTPRNILSLVRPSITAHVCTLPPDTLAALQAIGETLRLDRYEWRPWVRVSAAVLQIEADAGDAWGCYQRRRVPGSVPPVFRSEFDPRLPIRPTRQAAAAALARSLDPALAGSSDDFAARHGYKLRRLSGLTVQRVGCANRTAAALYLLAAVPDFLVASVAPIVQN